MPPCSFLGLRATDLCGLFDFSLTSRRQLLSFASHSTQGAQRVDDLMRITFARQIKARRAKYRQGLTVEDVLGPYNLRPDFSNEVCMRQ